ncbi:hypothetical protein EV127DRAFT_473127 [Xylaria flabelliformis]|nr:hypothetical protein EV127DRAFT_473127 [Xylaria flabelliformis]
MAWTLLLFLLIRGAASTAFTRFANSSIPTTSTFSTPQTIISLIPTGVSSTSSRTSSKTLSTTSVSVTVPTVSSPTTESQTTPLSSHGITSTTTTVVNPITSTVTIPPTGFSTEGITSSGLTTNTWITTTKDDHTTVVPILVGCPGCGGKSSGIVLWGLTPVINTVFTFPTFPTLPSFYLPCIQILGASIGSCSKGPSSPPDDSTRPTSQPEMSRTETSSSKATASKSTSSISSCEALTTATDIFVACSTGSVSGRATTDCYSTSTMIVSGCSVSATTTSSFTGGFCHIRPAAATSGPIGTYSFSGYAPFTLPDITGTISETISTTASTPKSSLSSANSSSSLPTSSSSSSTLPSSHSSSFESTTLQTSIRMTTSSVTRTNTSASTSTKSLSKSSTKLPSPTAAPDITIPTPTATPSCVEGFATYTLPAVASAPADAASLKFLIPAADTSDKAWEFDIPSDQKPDPRTNVLSWQVVTSPDGPPTKSGDGGEDMKIEWQSPKDPNGTYVELLFKSDPPLDAQKFNVVAKGGSFACLPSSCDGPPKVTTDKDGLTCKLYPCSTQPVCESGGPVTPEADCLVVDDGAIFPLWYDVTIVTNNWITDNGEKLKSEEKGCGAMTGWSVKSINEKSADGSWTASHMFTFTLPLTVKSGCVERAIGSAGGPSGLKCAQGTSDWVFV